MSDIQEIKFPSQQTIQLDSIEASDDAAVKVMWDAIDLGADIYYAAVAGLFVATRCQWVTISRILESKERVEVLAMWEGNQFADCIEYDLADTPCDLVLKSENVAYFQDVANQFPQDIYLQQLGAEDYIGLSFKGRDGSIIGHASLMDSSPFEELEHLEKSLRLICSALSLELNKNSH